MDAFALFGLPPTFDLDAVQLERTWLQRSRETHPDHHPGGDDHARAMVLERSAALNAAYRTLRDPWERAKAVLDSCQPGILEQTKRLDAAFLAEAMDLAESVASTEPARLPALRLELERQLAAALEQLAVQLRSSRWADAAVTLHRARYTRKALHDLRERA